MQNLLHDEIDATEALRNDVRLKVLTLWKAQLPAALALAKGDSEHAGSHLTEALQLIAGAVGGMLNDVTTKAMQNGAVAAKKRIGIKV